MARFGVVAAGVALLLAGIAGASSAELPRGWWKGTIVLEERWDQIVDNTGVKFSEKGSATVRITRTALGEAAYEVTYREETHWVGECDGALRMVKSASFDKSGPVEVSVSDAGAGVASRAVFAKHRDTPRVGLDQAQDQLHGGRLSGTVVPQKAVHLARLHRQVQTLQDRHPQAEKAGSKRLVNAV